MNTRYRILHLEDIPTDAELVARELKRNNIDFDHRVIYTEADYLRELDSFSPDIILCDHSLPSFNSLEAIRIIRKKKLHIPFILITATMSEEVALGVVREGADDYILKDRLKRLPNTVINNIEKYRFEKERKQLIDETHENEVLSKQLMKRLSDKLLLATRSAGIGVWEYSLSKQKFILDDVILKMYNIQPGSFDGSFENWISLVHPADRDRTTIKFKNALQASKNLNLEFRVIWNNGSVRFIKATILIERDLQGNITQVIGTNQDITASKEAELEIKESEKRFRELIQDLPEAMYTCDREGRIILYNKAAVELWGRKPVIGEELWCGSSKMYHSDGTPLLHGNCPMALTVKAGQASFQNEICIEKPSGERRHVRANPIPLFDKDRNITGAVNMLVDITRIKQVEEKLRASNARYQIVTKATNDAIWDWNLMTNEIYWNKSYERLFGYERSKEDRQVDKWRSRIHADDRERVEKSILEVINNGGTAWQEEYRYMKKNGEVAKVLDRGYLIHEGERPTRFVGAMQDITERKRVEEELRENQEQLLQSQRIAHIGSWQLNFLPDGNIDESSIKCSEETYRIIGLQADHKITYHLFFEFIHPHYRDMVRDAFAKAITEISSFLIDFRIENGPIKKRWVQQEAKIMTDPISGKPLKMFGTIKDITLQKEQELQITKNTEERELLIRELTKSIYDLKQFSYITSHNFRAPLSNLIGLLAVVDYDSLNSSNREIFDMFKVTTAQLNQTINDLVQILIIRNNVNIDIAVNDVNRLYQDVCNSLAHEIHEINCTIETDFKVETIRFNKPYLESILLNLISNAIKYRSPDRLLRIDLSTSLNEKNEVLLVIQDNGLGIDLKRHKESIFGLYQRFHSNPDSVGLGLFIVKSQITALGGSIEVQSEENVGTTFFITFKDK